HRTTCIFPRPGIRRPRTVVSRHQPGKRRQRFLYRGAVESPRRLEEQEPRQNDKNEKEKLKSQKPLASFRHTPGPGSGKDKPMRTSSCRPPDAPLLTGFMGKPTCSSYGSPM